MSKRRLEQNNSHFQQFNKMNQLADRLFWGFIAFVALSIASFVYFLTV